MFSDASIFFLNETRKHQLSIKCRIRIIVISHRLIECARETDKLFEHLQLYVHSGEHILRTIELKCILLLAVCTSAKNE